MSEIKSLLIIILSFISPSLFAQDYGAAYSWPEDRATAEEKVALYTDYISISDYRQAADNLHWLLKNAPILNLSIYQNGIKIYENLAIEALESGTVQHRGWRRDEHEAAHGRAVCGDNRRGPSKGITRRHQRWRDGFLQEIECRAVVFEGIVRVAARFPGAGPDPAPVESQARNANLLTRKGNFVDHG